MGGLKRWGWAIALGVAGLGAIGPGSWALPDRPIAIARSSQARSIEQFRWGSPRLESQLRLYRHYLVVHGRPPDLLIVGSSRSLQGIDPTVLARSLSAQGRSSVRVFNFSINGATAQVVRWLVMDLLPLEWLPRAIVWGDGSRAFNSGRTDRTYASIAASEGSRHLVSSQGLGRRPWPVEQPALLPVIDRLPPWPAAISSGPATGGVAWLLDRQRRPRSPLEPELDRLGFLADPRLFEPATYYHRFPKVPGRYDDMYAGFQLAGGPQDRAVRSLLAFARLRGITLSFVNLPLSGPYLDATRLDYERQFQRYLTQLEQRGLVVRDWLLRWPDRVEFFADPSHINRYGAAAIAAELGRDRLWFNSVRTSAGLAKTLTPSPSPFLEEELANPKRNP
ncbi:MAG: hypothetical protein EA001_10645 [Oscillatoriales cyanobacterium]|nr:MAG: hypothetical protein EA001_10645 [Oscillatoriales cyanobacterium]